MAAQQSIRADAEDSQPAHLVAVTTADVTNVSTISAAMARRIRFTIVDPERSTVKLSVSCPATRAANGYDRAVKCVRIVAFVLSVGTAAQSAAMGICLLMCHGIPQTLTLVGDAACHDAPSDDGDAAVVRVGTMPRPCSHHQRDAGELTAIVAGDPMRRQPNAVSLSALTPNLVASTYSDCRGLTCDSSPLPHAAHPPAFVLPLRI
jgi:hypothetical protein